MNKLYQPFSSYYIEQTTAPTGSLYSAPEVPDFEIERASTDNGLGKAKVTWHPNFSGTPGSHFYVQYRRIGEQAFLRTPDQTAEDHVEVGGLDSNKEYEFRVVSVDGNFETPSRSKHFYTSGGGES